DSLNPTGAEDADLAPGRAFQVGTNITWTYLLSNQSGGPLSVTSIRDDAGTPANPADDFSPLYVSGDANANNLLDAAEVWLFTSTGVRSYQVFEGQYGNIATVT